MRTLKISSLLLCSTLFINCGSGPIGGISAKKIQRLGLLDVEQAAELVEAELKSESLENRPEMLILAGEYRRLNGNYKESTDWFQEVLENHPTSPEKNAALLGLSMVDFESCRALLKDPTLTVPSETASRCASDKDWLAGINPTMDRVRTAQEEVVPHTLNADRYRLLYLAEVDKTAELAQLYKQKAEQYAPAHPITQNHYEQDIGLIDWDSPDFKDLTETAKLAKLQNALLEKDWQTAIPGADIFLELHPDSAFTFEVTAIKERAEVQENFVNKRIAVMLPLSGGYAPAAAAIRQSIEFTLKQTNDLEVIFYDTGWEPITPVVYEDPEKPTEDELLKLDEYNQAVELLNQSIEEKSLALVKKAVIDDGCGLIVGPLLKEVAPSVAKSAQAYGIPMLSMANSSSILSSGDLVHQVSLSLEQQIKPLVQHAMNVKEWKTFVAMVPDTEYGAEALETFTSVVEEEGGIVLRHIEYPAKATSFVTEARRLGLKSEVRPSEKQLEKDPTLDHPTIDFDAIFIPDNHRRTPLIASALAAEEFSIGSFRINRHAKPVGVLGLNKWSHPSIVKNGGQYLRNGVFVSAFWQEDPKQQVQNFVTEFETEFGKQPVITNALAHDAIIIADELFKIPQSSRISVHETLQKNKYRDLVTGGLYFTDDQILERNLHIMVIKKQLQMWVPPVIEEGTETK